MRLVGLLVATSRLGRPRPVQVRLAAHARLIAAAPLIVPRLMVAELLDLVAQSAAPIVPLVPAPQAPTLRLQELVGLRRPILLEARRA